MNGFEKLSELPYCVGSIDESHVKWRNCQTDQRFEYRCYKHLTSVVLFGVSDADGRFLCVDICLPGFLSDSTIYSGSRLKKLIDEKLWLGDETVHYKLEMLQ